MVTRQCTLKGKKDARKVSGPMLDSITEEYGVAQMFFSRFEKFNITLKDVFSDDWREVPAIAYGRSYLCAEPTYPGRSDVYQSVCRYSW
jgi:hypothetical protein